VSAYNTNISPVANQIVATITGPVLNTELAAQSPATGTAGEKPAGDLIADAMLEATSTGGVRRRANRPSLRKSADPPHPGFYPPADGKPDKMPRGVEDRASPANQPAIPSLSATPDRPRRMASSVRYSSLIV